MFNSTLYAGTVFHRRVRPTVHQLQYRVFSLLVDLDELPELHRKLAGFSWNGFNVFSIHDKDFGIDAQAGLRPGVDEALQSHGIHERPCKVYLSCYPRLFGYAFNPLSLYYCLREDKSIFAVVHEVHNTFGERHAYVLPVNEPAQWIQQAVDKALFVSPFAHMNMHYQFRLNVPDENQVVAIRLLDSDGLVLTASYSAKRKKLTSKSLAVQAIRMPWLSIKVVLGIHWEALRLWLKRVPWFSHVAKDSNRPPCKKM